MPPSTIPSTSSAISSPGRRFGSSDQKRRRNGAARPTRHDDSSRPRILTKTPQLDSAPKPHELMSEFGSPGWRNRFTLEPEQRECRAQMRDVREAARARGVQLRILKANNESEIDAAFIT